MLSQEQSVGHIMLTVKISSYVQQTVPITLCLTGVRTPQETFYSLLIVAFELT